MSDTRLDIRVGTREKESVFRLVLLLLLCQPSEEEWGVESLDCSKVPVDVTFWKMDNRARPWQCHFPQCR